MTDSHAPHLNGDPSRTALDNGSRSAARVTFGALWELCDADRVQAESLIETYAESMRATPAPPADAIDTHWPT